MKRKTWITISIITVLVLVFSVLKITKPSQADYAQWLASTYDLKCIDLLCNHFDVENEGNTIRMQSWSGSTSPGLFIFQKDIKYRNLDDPSYILDVSVKGLLGNIFIIEETNELMGR